MSPAIALFAAPAVRQALREGASGNVTIVLGSAAYITVASTWVLVGEAAQAFGPLSLQLRSPAQLELVPGAPVHVHARQLHVGEETVSLERMRERCTARRPAAGSVPANASAIAAANAASQADLPPAPTYLRAGLKALVAGSHHAAVYALAGLGEGLTPAGDDVLAGYAGWRAIPAAQRIGANTTAEAEPVLSELAALRSSPLGLAYLRCAERGELVDAGADLVLAVAAGSVGAAQAAIARLRAWGASSGIALAWGISAGVASLSYRGSLGEEPHSAGAGSRRASAAAGSPSTGASCSALRPPL